MYSNIDRALDGHKDWKVQISLIECKMLLDTILKLLLLSMT